MTKVFECEIIFCMKVFVCQKKKRKKKFNNSPVSNPWLKLKDTPICFKNVYARGSKATENGNAKHKA